MANLTIALPDEIYSIMKKHSEIRWSDIAKQAFEQYINRLKKMEQLEHEELMNKYDQMLENSKLTEEDVMDLDVKVKKGLSKRIKADRS